MINAQIDDIVLRAIGAGHHIADSIEREAERQGVTERTSTVTVAPTPVYRLVDQSLQRLRKRGAISYSRKTGWGLEEQ